MQRNTRIELYPIFVLPSHVYSSKKLARNAIFLQLTNQTNWEWPGNKAIQADQIEEYPDDL